MGRKRQSIPQGPRVVPRIDQRTYLMECVWCGWRNLVHGQHARLGPRSKFYLESIRRPLAGITLWDKQLDRAYMASEPVAGTAYGETWLARCGRPLIDPENEDLFWREDADYIGRLATERSDKLFCKSALFKNPVMLTKERAETIEAAYTIGGNEAVDVLLPQIADAYGLIRGGAGYTIGRYHYSQLFPLVRVLWVPRALPAYR